MNTKFIYNLYTFCYLL